MNFFVEGTAEEIEEERQSLFENYAKPKIHAQEGVFYPYQGRLIPADVALEFNTKENLKKQIDAERDTEKGISITHRGNPISLRDLRVLFNNNKNKFQKFIDTEIKEGRATDYSK